MYWTVPLCTALYRFVPEVGVGVGLYVYDLEDVNSLPT